MQLFHSLCSSWTWHDCCPLSRQISDILNFQVWSLPVVCSCLLWYTRELILYGLVFLLWSVPKVSACAWSDLVLVFLEPKTPSRESQSFVFPLLRWTTMFVGAAPCLFISGGINMAVCCPVLFVTPSYACTHTHKHTQIPSTYLGANPRTDIAWYFLLPPLLTSRCWHKCLACHGEHFPAYCETFIGQNEFCITPIFQRITG